MGTVVRVLDVIFWLTTALLVSALIFLDYPGVNAILIAVMVVCSGVIALYEFRLSPQAETGRGGGSVPFYAVAFAISLLVAFIYTVVVVF